MGIQDLYTVIKAECPDQLDECALTDLSGQRIAVDASIFLYRYIRSCGDSQWMSAFIVFLITLKKAGITAVFIFDGPNPPREKQLEQESRRAQLTRSVNRMNEGRRLRDIIRKEYIPITMAVTGQLRRECEIVVGDRNKTVINYDDPYDVLQAMSTIVAQLEKQTMPITDNHRRLGEEIVKLMGLACLRADGEAEALCSQLAVSGQVDGVLTEDTDVLAHGTPYMYCFKDNKIGSNKINYICLDSLLADLEMTFEEFQDLCILLGCDYNDRVKGFPPDGTKRKKPISIGAKHAVTMIREYRRLEEVCKHVDDERPLNYRRCRELFATPSNIPTIHPYQRLADAEDIQAFFDKHRITLKIDYVLSAWAPTELNFETSDDEDDFALDAK